MDIERRALFHSLRQHWLIDPELPIEKWQVTDYRSLKLEELFHLLAEQGYHLDRESFLAYAEISDTPEEMTMNLIVDDDKQTSLDRLYLILFELWRRLRPECRSLSIFCDDLDYYIDLYDSDHLSSMEPLEDLISELIEIIVENKERGENPQGILSSITKGCSNNIETFLFDFISHVIDQHNYSYAKDLIKDLDGAFEDPKWLTLLEARLLIRKDPDESYHLIDCLIDSGEEDLDFYFELLNFLVQAGDENLFKRALIHAFALIETQEEYVDLISFVQDYFHCLERYSEEKFIVDMMDKHQKNEQKSDFKFILEMI